MASNAQSTQAVSQTVRTLPYSLLAYLTCFLNQDTIPQAPAARPIDVYSLEAPAGVEQPYLSRMIPLDFTGKDDIATRAVDAYGVGWSMVQGPPSLFAGTSTY